tara:strand:+ start:1977 stop:2651 length:675 start_codon:yes stop_codon:yes gene_type:complete
MEKIIFVSFVNGAGGHKFSRVLCSLPNIHWYSSLENGTHPWNISNPISDRRKVSKYDFETPFTYLRNSEDWLKIMGQEYNNDDLWKRFDSELGDKTIVVPTHRLPQELYKRYPNSKIFNLIKDLDVCATRCADIVGNYKIKDMGTVENVFVSPTDRSKFRKYKDVWALEKYNSYYDVWHRKRFIEYMKQSLQANYDQRIVSDYGFMVNMNKKINWKEVKRYLNE